MHIISPDEKDTAIKLTGSEFLKMVEAYHEKKYEARKNKQENKSSLTVMVISILAIIISLISLVLQLCSIQ